MSGSRESRGGKQKGALVSGVWHCDCDPRLPAVHLPVKKEGASKGKWFRVCQKERSNETRCKFFLWDADAAKRERKAFESNTRTEPGMLNDTTPSRPQPQRAAAPPQPYTPDAGPSDPTKKRTRQNAQDDDDDEFGMGDDLAFDEEMAQAVEAVETPSKKPRTEPFTTPPRRRLPWEKDKAPQANGLQTPQTEQRSSNNLFSTRFTEPGSSFLTPSKYKQSDETTSQTLTPASSPIAPIETPTPARFQDAQASTENDLARDVCGVLLTGRVQLTDQVRRNLTSVLSNYSLRAEGISKGRDVMRALNKANEAKVKELTYRVETLKAELEAEKEKVGHLEWRIRHGQQSE